MFYALGVGKTTPLSRTTRQWQSTKSQIDTVHQVGLIYGDVRHLTVLNDAFNYT